MLSQSIKNHRTLLAKSPGLPRRATMGCDNPPLPKRSCSFVAVSAMNEQAIDFANSIGAFVIHGVAGNSAEASMIQGDISQPSRGRRIGFRVPDQARHGSS